MIMCMLCVVHRWSRRVATMLPWLVIPLILIWALSLLLPPNFRFEITSPRLACVVVLLITLVWYEILMPMLSTWRARRSARIKEERRTQAIELQKLKRLATRRCRNCFTPYRDQNPGGGKFMCSYCGHISKRPVLDLPGWQDWSGESVSGPPRFWVNGGRGGDERCLTEKSYSGVLVFGCRLVGSFFLKVRWVWRKVFRVGSGEDDSLNGEGKGLSNKRGENGGSFQESRGERARRKAEEKRLARLEREMLEEEERKQREEVARLVEERRRLRDEKLEAERSRSKTLGVDGERDSRRETERRRRERRREKDKGSSKSNSDGEDLEKRTSRENEKKRDFDKKSQIERTKATAESLKSQSLEGNGNKVVGNKTRYFDRMKGTLLSSSRSFNGSSFFGRNAQTAVTVTKVSKPAGGFIDNGQNSGTKKDTHSSGNAIGKSTPNGDHRPVETDVLPRATVPKKSWHQLFTRSSAVSPDPDTNSVTFGNPNWQPEARSVLDQKAFPSYSVDNQFNFRRSLPLAGYSSPNSSNGSLASNFTSDSMFPPIKEPMHNGSVEDSELFEDPCYVPDPLSLLGPVSDQLDKFPLDLGNGFIETGKVETPRVLKNACASTEGSKPSPIESPLSRSRDERLVSCTPKSQKLHSSKPDELNDMQGTRTWQMWGTPLAWDGLGLADGPSNWFSPLVQSKSNQDVSCTLGHNPVVSQVETGIPLPSILTPRKASVGTLQNGGTFGTLGPGLLNGRDPWVQNSPFPSPLPVDGENHFLPLDLMDNIAQNEVTYGSSTSGAAVHHFEVPRANGWSKAAKGMTEVTNSSPPVKPPNVGGLFSTGPDVQSVWSFNHQ
ncbi:stress response protein nst1-like isoform X1 [Asparagus officinalis]|uniref:stress response protein nst1-like isoform X1 n=2 Tax=Asparagus officinalis TaxID=4686 RepID=UPI00098E5A2B|nr:stress response protein nst1-like isoform X1 [Asparagus officinalis]XP_020277111.1 stress response protein nst1-like isoform X1 [Asparagus officinalis]